MKLAIGTILIAVTTLATPQSINDVVVVDGTERIQMKYSIADTKISSNMLGGKAHSTLNGQKADLRVRSASPQFLLYSDPAVNVSNAVVLIRLDVKSDHARFEPLRLVWATSPHRCQRIMLSRLTLKRFTLNLAIVE